jgi:hypothetical protein
VDTQNIHTGTASQAALGQPAVRELTADELAQVLRWYNAKIAWVNQKPQTRRPPGMSAGARKLAFRWRGDSTHTRITTIVVLSMERGWRRYLPLASARLSPLTLFDVADAVLVGVA